VIFLKIFVLDDLCDIDDVTLEIAMEKVPHARRKYANKYRNKKDRILCVYSYLLLKFALMATQDIIHVPEFVLNEYGKPSLKDFPVHFNISHCCKGVCCALSEQPVGIDIQNTVTCSDVMHHVMCEEEIALIKRSVNRDEVFTRLWTLKESYLKMLGIGLCDEMRKLNFASFSTALNLRNNILYYTFYQSGYWVSAATRDEDQIEMFIIESKEAILYPKKSTRA